MPVGALASGGDGPTTSSGASEAGAMKALVLNATYEPLCVVAHGFMSGSFDQVVPGQGNIKVGEHVTPRQYSRRTFSASATVLPAWHQP